MLSNGESFMRKSFEIWVEQRIYVRSESKDSSFQAGCVGLASVPLDIVITPYACYFARGAGGVKLLLPTAECSMSLDCHFLEAALVDKNSTHAAIMEHATIVNT